jgi:tetratricopeptide (TPR) repeat protein
MRRIIVLIIALLFIRSYLFSYAGEEDVLKEADLLLDMMEYESAIDNYSKVLAKEPELRDIRKNIAYAYFKLEKIDNAFEYLKEELTAFPDNGDAYDLLVYILFKLNKLDEADDIFEKFGFPQKLEVENPDIGGLGCFILGIHFKEAKKYGEARTYLRKALEKGHNPVKCYVQLIDIDLVQGELEYQDWRRDILTEAFEVCGYQPEFFFMHGLRYSEKSKTNVLFLLRAIGYFKRALELRPDFEDALINLACLGYNYDDFKGASEYFRKILELEPENSQLKFYLDCSLKKLSKSMDKEKLPEPCPKTINLSRKFVDNPDREYLSQFKNDKKFVLENINFLGLEFIKRGKNLEAIRRFRNALEIYPECPEVNFNLGMVLSWLQNFKEAEKHALIALRKRDFFGSLPTYLVQKNLKEKPDSIRGTMRIPLSEWTFEVAIKEGNIFLEAYDLLGNIYFKKGDFERSILAFKKVIEINPEDAMGHYNLGCACAALNDWQNAETEWKKAIQYEEELRRVEERRKISEDELNVSLIVFKRAVSFQAHKSLGGFYLERNLLDKAAREYEEAIKIESGDQESYYSLGKIYQAKKDNRKAIFFMKNISILEEKKRLKSKIF